MSAALGFVKLRESRDDDGISASSSPRAIEDSKVKEIRTFSDDPFDHVGLFRSSNEGTSSAQPLACPSSDSIMSGGIQLQGSSLDALDKTMPPSEVVASDYDRDDFLMNIDISFGKGRQDRIRVCEDDEPESLAKVLLFNSSFHAIMLFV